MHHFSELLPFNIPFAFLAILFWLSAALLVYTHLGYPLVLAALVRLRKEARPFKPRGAGSNPAGGIAEPQYSLTGREDQQTPLQLPVRICGEEAHQPTVLAPPAVGAANGAGGTEPSHIADPLTTFAVAEANSDLLGSVEEAGRSAAPVTAEIGLDRWAKGGIEGLPDATPSSGRSTV